VPCACNPSYSGGRDQEDCSSKPAWANSSTKPYLKKPFTEKGCGVAQSESPAFNHPVPKKKKEHITLKAVQWGNKIKRNKENLVTIENEKK
jgi:hypothetical protein